MTIRLAFYLVRVAVTILALWAVLYVIAARAQMSPTLVVSAQQRDPLLTMVTPAWQFNLMLAVLVQGGHQFTGREMEIIEDFAAETWPDTCNIDTLLDPRARKPEREPSHYYPGVGTGIEKHVCKARQAVGR